MNKNDKRYPLTYVMLIGILSIIISWWWIPPTYYYNSDVYISPAGMMISESYRTVPWHVSQGIPGFYGQGIYAVYNSWPPLNFLALAGWQECFGTDVLSSRWMYVIVKLLTDLLCFIILFRITKNKIVSFIATGVFLIFPYRILYSLLLFSDSWVLLFGALITLLLIRAIKQGRLFRTGTIFGIGLLTGIGTLFSWQVFFYLPA
ncbi:MAG TPA: hypothetical protein VLJ68_07775, partial [Chitinophagaceae bacterium]|nr:hypothetical protein [Chitinophagaceae bacterium]